MVNRYSIAHPAIRLAGVFMLLTAIIVGPFLMFGNEIASVVRQLLQHQTTGLLFVMIVLLLAADLFLPIPSSIVAVAAGAYLGFWLGFEACVIGMTLGCVVGYIVGTKGAAFFGSVITARELEYANRFSSQKGSWLLPLCRSIPVLAEVSVVAAGIAKFDVTRFLIIVTLANAGISATYCALGDEFLTGLPFLATIVIAVVLHAGMSMTSNRYRILHGIE